MKEEKKIEEMRQELQKLIMVSGDQPKEEKVKRPKLIIYHLQVPILISSDRGINLKHKSTSLIYTLCQN